MNNFEKFINVFMNGTLNKKALDDLKQQILQDTFNGKFYTDGRLTAQKILDALEIPVKKGCDTVDELIKAFNTPAPDDDTVLENSYLVFENGTVIGSIIAVEEPQHPAVVIIDGRQLDIIGRAYTTGGQPAIAVGEYINKFS